VTAIRDDAVDTLQTYSRAFLRLLVERIRWRSEATPTMAGREEWLKHVRLERLVRTRMILAAIS
jgi:hypothetical protein